MPSTAVDGQSEFLSLLEAAFPDPTTHVGFAGSGKTPKQYELVWVLPVRNYRKQPAEQFDVETYHLAVRVLVLKPGDSSTTAADADGRRWEIIDAAENALLRADFHGFRTHGGEVLVEEAALDLYDKGWVADSTVLFGCATRLPLI